ncbi:methenyltetrahydrofolate synthase domain-containing protein isoform X1 [Colossoma macropomum]|uniref:methenyltetrahydrofolate synthase domain-containing protein isoform X1 n=1 Tax=Colossoma macropomum TaxID=42526 RepID=UPI001863BA77|nr:methenyltetrahydrofolate synthase domain-containing protein isoform X1 [Colossoma macropomum]
MEQAININQGATKWDIRQKVWDYIEAKNLANFPRPVHHRIPNFKGAYGACNKIVTLDVFSKTSEVKVDPDKPLEGARLAALQARKTLLVPTPRLRTGLFNKIVPPQNATNEDLRVCSTSQGVKEFSVPIGLDARVQVDLVVVGSVAVSEKGYRIGKGEGFADMEYAMMASMGAVNESTVVVTMVHDCQVVDIPEGLTESHDLTVDYIITPTRIVKTECQHPKPQGIIWSKLDAEMLEKIPILKKLRALEQKAGNDVTLKVSSAESVKPAAEPKPEAKPNPKRDPKSRPRHEPKQEPKRQYIENGAERPGGGAVEQEHPRGSSSTLYLGGIPAGLRVSELKTVLRERNAVPLRLTWQGAQHRAFLEYNDGPGADLALTALQDLSINGHTLKAERAKSQRGGHRPNQTLQRPQKKEAKGAAHPPTATAAIVSITTPSEEGS